MRHCRYFRPSHTAHAMSTIPTTPFDTSAKVPSSSWKASTRMIASGIPVRMLREKYHQCGRRSRARVSPSCTRLSGYGMSRRLRPPELVEAHLVHAEVVADLVEHGHPHLGHELVEVSGAPRQRSLEDGDAVGRDAGVAE